MIEYHHKHIAWVVITAVAILLHLVALYYLIKIYSKNKNMRSCQFNLLINLSAAELVKNLLYFLSYITILASPEIEYVGDIVPECLFRSKIEEGGVCTAQKYLMNQAGTSATYCYFFAMFLLTGDRLLAVLLSLRYRSMCTVPRVRVLIVLTWFLCFCINLPVITGYYFDKGYFWLIQGDEKVISRTEMFYIPPVLAIGFVAFSCITYALMFIVYAKSRRQLQQAPESLFRTFINSSFYISVLLITSFLVLTVVPFLVNIHYDRLKVHMAEPVMNYVSSSLHLSDVVDAVIYILLYRPVRNMMICF